MFHRFLVVSRRLGTHVSFHFLLFLLCSPQVRQSQLFGRFSFLLTITRSDRLAEIRLSVWARKHKGILCVSFSRTDSMLCIYQLFTWSNYSYSSSSSYYYYCTIYYSHPTIVSSWIFTAILSYILIVCMRDSHSLSFFANRLMSSMFIVVVFFLLLSKFVAHSALPKYVIEWNHCYYK